MEADVEGLIGASSPAAGTTRLIRATAWSCGAAMSGCCWWRSRPARLVGRSAFPQAFSHITLVNTAHNLTLAARPAAQRLDCTEVPTPAVSARAAAGPTAQ